jgi:hypothetical protein
MDENPLSFDHEKEMNLAKVRWLNILQFQIWNY